MSKKLLVITVTVGYIDDIIKIVKKYYKDYYISDCGRYDETMWLIVIHGKEDGKKYHRLLRKLEDKYGKCKIYEHLK